MECAIPLNAPKKAEKRVVAVYPNGAVRPAVGHAWRNVVCRNVLVQLMLQFDVFATFLCCNLACRMSQLYIRNVSMSRPFLCNGYFAVRAGVVREGRREFGASWGEARRAEGQRKPLLIVSVPLPRAMNHEY